MKNRKAVVMQSIIVLMVLCISCTSHRADFQDEIEEENAPQEEPIHDPQVTSEGGMKYDSTNGKNDSSMINSMSTKPILSTPSDTAEFLKAFKQLKLAAKYNDMGAFNEFIHPKHGCYYVYRPGSGLAYELIRPLTVNWNRQGLRVKDLFRVIGKMEVQFERWPTYTDCGYDGFSKEGAFAVRADGYDYLSKLSALNKVEYDTQESPEELKNIADVESHIWCSVINANPDYAMTLNFMKVGKKWYLGVFNTGRFNCDG